jgi:hypothetical protein
MADAAPGLDEIRRRLLDLHKALVDAGRRDYERVHGRQSDPAFLEVLVKDAGFAWLGAITGLIARLDEALEEGETSAQRWSDTIRQLLVPDAAGSEFNRKYAQYTQQVPDVLVAHGAVLRALPLPTRAAAGATDRSA